MTAPAIIREQRIANLDAFEAALVQLEGVEKETLDALCRASTTRGSSPRFPVEGDLVGNQAYLAAALRALAEALLAQQEGSK
jgi:hypothetical protein